MSTGIKRELPALIEEYDASNVRNSLIMGPFLWSTELATAVLLARNEIQEGSHLLESIAMHTLIGTNTSQIVDLDRVERDSNHAPYTVKGSKIPVEDTQFSVTLEGLRQGGEQSYQFFLVRYKSAPKKIWVIDKQTRVERYVQRAGEVSTLEAEGYILMPVAAFGATQAPVDELSAYTELEMLRKKKTEQLMSQFSKLRLRS